MLMRQDLDLRSTLLIIKQFSFFHLVLKICCDEGKG